MEVREGIPEGNTRIICIATETADALLRFPTYLDGVSERLTEMTWGAEDLMAALGATENRDPETGEYDAPFMLARSLALATARAINAKPIGAVFTDFKNDEGLTQECHRDRRRGFTGKLAIHPDQVPIINDTFTPTEDEISWAKKVIAIFHENPGVSAASLEGKMLDMTHLKQARNVLALVEELNHK